MLEYSSYVATGVRVYNHERVRPGCGVPPNQTQRQQTPPPHNSALCVVAAAAAADAAVVVTIAIPWMFLHAHTSRYIMFIHVYALALLCAAAAATVGWQSRTHTRTDECRNVSARTQASQFASQSASEPASDAESMHDAHSG